MKRNFIPEVCTDASPPKEAAPFDPQSTGTNGPSRRTFLKCAGLGTAGTALVLSGAFDTLGYSQQTNDQNPNDGSAVDGHASGNELGEVTLDGLMITYFSIPPAFAPATFSFGKNFSTAFTLKLPNAPGISLAGLAPENSALADGHSQRTSSWVKNGIALLSSSEGGAKSGNELPHSRSRYSSAEAVEPLQIYGLLHPRLVFSGTPEHLQFCFSDIGRRSFNLGREVSAETAASMYSQYITDPSRLFPPRFYWLDVPAKSGQTTFDFSLPSRLVVKNGITATATSRITDQAGFSSKELREAFAPGNEIEITYYSSQEFPSKSLMELQTTPSNSKSRIYIDRVFRTFVMGPKLNGG